MAHMEEGHHMATGMAMGECAMKMTLNWDVENICVVVSSWRIEGGVSMAISCLIVVILGILYELLRGVSSQWDTLAQQKQVLLQQRRTERNREVPLHSYGVDQPCLDDTEEDHRDHEILNMEVPHLRNVSELHSGNPFLTTRWTRIPRSVLYGTQVFYSFMLMLIFMTYNGYLMVSVGVGAAIGYYLTVSYLPLLSSRSAACH